MSSRSLFPSLIACGAFLFAAGCSDSSSAPNQTTTTLTLVSPAGGATSVDPAVTISLTFSGPMAQGMENYMDVHAGTTADATVPMSCTWSADRTTLTCTHAAPFAAASMYTIHVGAGMMDADGHVINMQAMVNTMGGTWLMPGMMGGMHAGQPMTTMGQGWQGSNGSYGMMFTFTTGQPATTLALVSPAGGATNVAPTAAISMTFSGPMAQGMENYMDVHAGTAADAIMPMTCTWSADRTTLTCTHAAPFAGASTYTIHVGGGMMDANGHPIDMDAMVNMMGGVWLMPGMMGGMHAGQPMNMMGQGWQGTNGSYGMMFTFTTA
jgi:hypothetical protein